MDLFYEDLRLLIPAQGDTTAPKMAMRSFLSNLVVADVFDVIQCWDPGLPDGSVFIEFARPCDGFHWDPGAVEGLCWGCGPKATEIPKPKLTLGGRSHRTLARFLAGPSHHGGALA
jgi:hypothetical protein